MILFGKMRFLLPLLLLVGGCDSHFVPPDPALQAHAVEVSWRGSLAISERFPLPDVTWFAHGDDGCGNPPPGTAFANGACVGGSITVAGDHITSGANLEWTGTFSSSALCWAFASLKDYFDTGVLYGIEGPDARIDACRADLVAAGY